MKTERALLRDPKMHQGFEMDYCYVGKCVFIKSMRMLRIEKDMFPLYRFHIRHANESKLQLEKL